MFLANLHGTKGGVPLPSRTRPCGSLYIFDSGISQGQHGGQVAHDPRFGFPPTPCRRGETMLAARRLFDRQGRRHNRNRRARRILRRVSTAFFTWVGASTIRLQTVSFVPTTL